MSASIDKYRLVTQGNSSNPLVAEAYRTLRTNLYFASGNQEIRTLLVTSTLPNEGKSTTISNLAIAYAESDKKVLLIDADLRRPTLHQVFSASTRLGLSYLLTGQCKIEEAIIETFVPNLALITAGPPLPNPYGGISSPRFEELLEELKARYDIILIDSSPILAVSDAQLLSKRCDGVLYIVHYGKVKRALAQRAVAQLRHSGANLLGVVVNNKKKSKQDKVYSY